jgi:hypothetical protein
VSTLTRHGRICSARFAQAIAALTGLGTIALAGPLLAAEGNPGPPERLDLSFTEATSAFYNIDNRNTRTGDVTRRLDDDWGVWYNRLNAQASYGHVQAGLRLDSALFQSTATPVGLGRVSRG